MGERVYLIVDGIDGRVHHIEFKDASRIEEVGADMIVVASPSSPVQDRPTANIAKQCRQEDNGIYRPSRHLKRVHDSFERQGKYPEAFVRSHVRRLEALRRGRLCRTIERPYWEVPKDIVERGQAYDLSQGADGPRVPTRRPSI